jgi:hypothetical protein
MMRQIWGVICDSDTDSPKGYECCATDEITGTKSRAKKEFKKSGWTFKKGKSFCPMCSKPERPNP